MKIELDNQGGLFGECSNKILSDFLSPNGKYQAYYFLRSCGVTTGYSTHISLVLDESSLPNEKGNIFIASVSDLKYVGDEGEVKLNVRWDGKNILVIEYPKEAHIFAKKSQYKNILIKANAKL